MSSPLVTIGIVGCNRLHYVKALLESAHDCIEYDNLEWIVVDNASEEPGLRKYLEGLDYVQHMIFRPERSPATEHVEAMNRIVEMARGDYLLLMPDDIQFIEKGPWLHDLVDIAAKRKKIGSIVLDAQFRRTLKRFFLTWGFLPGALAHRYPTYTSQNGRQFIGYGKSKIGVNPAGIGTFTRTEVWRKLGPWKTTGEQQKGDSTGGGEVEMLERYWASKMKLERVMMRVPVAASIYTGADNGQAYVRAGRRFGQYIAPKDGDFYYRIQSAEKMATFADIEPGAAYEDVVQPIGYQFKVEDDGSMIKWSKSVDDPSEAIVKKK